MNLIPPRVSHPKARQSRYAYYITWHCGQAGSSYPSHLGGDILRYAKHLDTMSLNSLTQDDIDRILSYLELPPATTLPSPPLRFLSDHIAVLPPPLLEPFSQITSPRERASIPTIKSRRLIYATQVPIPPELTAEKGRLRWPLLWERMGGSSLPPPSADVREEEAWVAEHFLPGKENVQHVKKLGGFLRGLEEEREMENVVMARRAERRLDDVGEEFDEESDEEDEELPRRSGPGSMDAEEQEEVRRAFEKRILEMFVDGVDVSDCEPLADVRAKPQTVPYDHVDFAEPAGGDPIGARDREDAYFDDEEPSRTPNGHDQGGGVGHAESLGQDDRSKENGQGEYDY